MIELKQGQFVYVWLLNSREPRTISTYTKVFKPRVEEAFFNGRPFVITDHKIRRQRKRGYTDRTEEYKKTFEKLRNKSYKNQSDILGIFDEEPLSKSHISSKLDLTISQFNYAFKKLIESNKIVKTGSGKFTKYKKV